MRFLTYEKIYEFAWIACAATLPWAIFLNSWSLVFLALVWLAGLYQVKEKRNNFWYWPFLLFFGLHILGLIFSDNISLGLLSLETKLSLVLLPLAAGISNQWNSSFHSNIKNAFIVSCLIGVIWNLFYALFLVDHSLDIARNFDPATHNRYHELNPNAHPFWEYFSYIQVGKGMGIHPTYFSMFLVFGTNLLFFRVLTHIAFRYASAAIFILFTFFILLLSSRISIIALIITNGIILLWNANKQNQLTKGLFYSALAISFLTLCIWLNPVSRFRIIQEPSVTNLNNIRSNTSWNSINLRLLEWKASWDRIEENPLWGVGTGDGRAEMQFFYKNYNSSTAKLAYDPHNQFLQTLLELGIVGLLGLLLCLFIPLYKVKFDILHMNFILILFIMCLSECILERQKGIVFFSLFQSVFIKSKFS